jgi:hypothetical protein
MTGKYYFNIHKQPFQLHISVTFEICFINPFWQKYEDSCKYLYSLNYWNVVNTNVSTDIRFLCLLEICTLNCSDNEFIMIWK